MKYTVSDLGTVVHTEERHAGEDRMIFADRMILQKNDRMGPRFRGQIGTIEK